MVEMARRGSERYKVAQDSDRKEDQSSPLRSARTNNQLSDGDVVAEGGADGGDRRFSELLNPNGRRDSRKAEDAKEPGT